MAGFVSGYRDALGRLAGAQKRGAGVPAYTRWINRRAARHAAAIAHQLGWSPNTVTSISAALSAVGIGVLVALPASPPSGIAAGLLLAAGYVLDSADGQVARLSGSSSPAGEWVDHVVDAIRSPAIHLAVLVGLLHASVQVDWRHVVALLFCLVTTGQFMSQILAEKLRKPQSSRATSGAGVRQSLLLLPTDTGVLCLSFLLWGWPAIFIVVYTTLFVVNVAHTAVSMRRRYRELLSVGGRGRE